MPNLGLPNLNPNQIYLVCFLLPYRFVGSQLQLDIWMWSGKKQLSDCSYISRQFPTIRSRNGILENLINMLGYFASVSGILENGLRWWSMTCCPQSMEIWFSPSPPPWMNFGMLYLRKLMQSKEGGWPVSGQGSWGKEGHICLTGVGYQSDPRHCFGPGPGHQKSGMTEKWALLVSIKNPPCS